MRQHALHAMRKLRLYQAALACIGAGAVFVLASAGFTILLTRPLVALLAAMVCLTAIVTGWLARDAAGTDLGGIGPAVPLAFALSLVGGTAVAVLTLGIGLLIASLRHRPLSRACAAVGSPILALLVAGAVGHVLTGSSAVLDHASHSVGDLAAIAVAGALLFVVDMVVGAVAVALTQRIAVGPLVMRQLGAHASTGAVLLSVAPVVIVVATTSPALVPLLALPVAAVYRSARAVAASEHLALHDVLTGLPNRRLFLERLAVALQEAKEHEGEVAVLLIDLDRFKEVNDRLGHHIGDLLLQEVGPALQSQVSPDVTVARLGGDEFALCVPHVDGADEAVRIAKALIARLTQPFQVDRYTLDIGASIGIALYPTHAQDVSTAMRHADIAMYVAKEMRGGYELYAEERDPNRRQRVTSPAELRRATELDQLVLHYLPKACVRTGAARGVEALVRWNHPTLGLIGPGEFIPLAERSGLMTAITTFVMARSLEQLREWKDLGYDLRLAVNVSVQSLYDDAFPGMVAGLLERSEVPPVDLVLDVTESTVMADPRRAQRVLSELGAMGVTLAIDDFGTGYSSLAYLRQMPVRELKIDQSFVLGMATEGDDAIIVHSTIDLGQRFGLDVVAEGVESGRVWNLLQRLGCDMAQGSYVCPPKSAEELTAWLEENKRLASDGPGGEVIKHGYRIGRIPAS